jgi:hypothetical protein
MNPFRVALSACLIVALWPVGIPAAGTDNPAASTLGRAVTVSPAPLAGNMVKVIYTAAGRDLDDADQVYLHLCWDSWHSVISPDVAMTFNGASNFWECIVFVPDDATNMNFCFNDGSGSWDNNNATNWSFSVTGALPLAKRANPGQRAERLP